MLKTIRDYSYPVLMAMAALLVIAGAVMFYMAGSFQGYIGALLFLALAAVAFVGARELKPKIPPGASSGEWTGNTEPR